MDGNFVMSLAKQCGADLAGIALPCDFKDAPEGFRPVDKLPSCRAVIVLASPFPQDALLKNTVEYTDIRNMMVEKMDQAAEKMAQELKLLSLKTKVIKGTSGKWHEGRFRGAISLKHAAQLAGLGVITKNYLLTNKDHGNLLWFSAVLTDAEIEPDKPVKITNPCQKCGLCHSACPAGALSQKLVLDHDACRRTCYKTIKGKLEFKCFECRKICPHRLGIK